MIADDKECIEVEMSRGEVKSFPGPIRAEFTAGMVFIVRDGRDGTNQPDGTRETVFGAAPGMWARCELVKKAVKP